MGSGFLAINESVVNADAGAPGPRINVVLNCYENMA